MTVAGLDHINLAAPRAVIERVRTFYIDVLGLVEGERPPFRSPGYWLYAAGRPIVHLSVRETDSAATTGPVDHFALACEGLGAMLERLARHGIAHRTAAVPGRAQVQIFLQDPAGVKLELNFSGEALTEVRGS
jgi:catechol 2,3-dioxygenase-like lactoylglutathione lyase family enzyme